ncbi:unnamed protein product [Gongylonema pulchrum]|uniref:Replication factor C subunit 1 n=1 Tax=Gongylonema pulchrum TaxID=637853 RepID=A0A183DPS2_9BILA|nr:unnamed protein product [Gongylonema pulchrum]
MSPFQPLQTSFDDRNSPSQFQLELIATKLWLCATEIEESDKEELASAPPTKKKRGRTPPGQTKLDVTNIGTKQKLQPKRRSAKIAPELGAVTPLQFFQNFDKATGEVKAKKKAEGQGGSQQQKTKAPEESAETELQQGSPKKVDKIGSKTKSSKKSGEVQGFSPGPSPRKSSRRRADEVDVLVLSDENVESSSVLSDLQSKISSPTRKSPRKVGHFSDKGSVVTEVESKKKKVEKQERETAGKAQKKDTAEQKKGMIASATKQKKSPDAKKSSAVNEKRNENLGESDIAAQKVHLVGQSGEKSPMNKLLAWLRDWAKNHLNEGGKKKKARPPPWMAQNDSTAFRAALLSGPPGVGKTTCAVMACKELGLQYVEKNASDVRNKKMLEAQTSGLIGCQQMDDFMTGPTAQKPPQSNEVSHVLIMDEVDGMSGNNDRAGIAELIKMIKMTKIPIICICNDRQSQKIRSLVNYCFDLRFQRPRVEQIRARLLTIMCQERCKVEKEKLDEIIEASLHDVRQSIYNLQLLTSRNKEGNEMQRKNAAINTFEATRRLLRADTPVWEKQQMFFVDYSIMPLFVHENYPFVHNSEMSANKRLFALKNAADSISMGDIIERTIRTTGSWSLLNEQALFSAVVPCTSMNGYMKGMISFPSWLGRNSTAMKRQRLLRQLTTHTYLRTLAATSPIVLDYIPILRDRYCRPLLEKESGGVGEVIELYKKYNLIKNDTESIAELAVWPGIIDSGAAIPTKVKAALTRTLNKEHIILPYATDTVSKGRKRATAGAFVNSLNYIINVEWTIGDKPLHFYRYLPTRTARLS